MKKRVTDAMSAMRPMRAASQPYALETRTSRTV